MRNFLGALTTAAFEPRSGDEDAKRWEYILNILLIGSIAMLLACDALVLYYAISKGGDHASGISFLTFSIFPAFFIFLYALSRRGRFVVASYLLVGAYFLGNSYAAYRWGVNVPTMLVGYALLIVIASVLIGARFACVVAFATALVVLPLWYLQLHGAMFRDAENFTDGDGVALVVLYGLITLVAWLSNREIERSLARARRSERELKEERDLLEVKVEERTRELRAAELDKFDQLYRFAEFGQLASGLFHDLLNLLQVVSLRAEQTGGIDNFTKAEADADSIGDEIERFRDALRRQLSRDDVKERFSLATSVEGVIQFLSYQAKSAGVRIEYEKLPEQLDAFDYFGSPFKFHQVAVNLILNAIESFESFEPCRGKRVMIRLAREDGFALFTVADSGCGIPPDLFDKIFEPFFTTKHNDKKGIGIGLAITKRIVESDFGGMITVTNRPGGGALFAVRFPMK